MRVRVFRNLTARKLSIMARVPNAQGKLGWRTVAHADVVQLDNLTAYISQAGRKRVLETGRKHVHAWLEGDLGWMVGGLRLAALQADQTTWETLRSSQVSQLARPNSSSVTQVTYNPHRFASFVTTEGHNPVTRATWGYMTPGLTLLAGAE